MSNLFCAIEGGGTTWVVAIASGSPENIIERAEVHLAKQIFMCRKLNFHELIFRSFQISFRRNPHQQLSD